MNKFFNPISIKKGPFFNVDNLPAQTAMTLKFTIPF